jgi:hypothetical protein
VGRNDFKGETWSPTLERHDAWEPGPDVVGSNARTQAQALMDFRAGIECVDVDSGVNDNSRATGYARYV